MNNVKKQKELFALCQRFIEDNEIAHPEKIMQCDHVIENAYEFIEGICDIVGYHKYPEDLE